MKKKVLDRPEKVRSTLEELEVLEHLKTSLEWAIFKRMCGRYRRNLRKVSFNLRPNDPNLMHRHAELGGQDLGVKAIIDMVDKIGEQKKKEEKKRKK